MRTTRNTVRNTLATLAGTALVAGMSLMFNPVANAAPHDPLDCTAGAVIAIKGAEVASGPKELLAGTFEPGGISFAAAGPVTDFAWNATGINPVDGYVYGLAYPGGSLIQVGADASAVNLGAVNGAPSGTAAGAFDEAGTFWVLGADTTVAHQIDVTTRTATELEMSEDPGVVDITFADGFMWGLTSAPGEGTNLVRIDPDSGQVTRTPVAGVPDGTESLYYPGAFTLGNGYLQFTGHTNYQIRVDDPAGTPVATVVGTRTMGMEATQDAASCFTGTTDLSLIKSAPEAVKPGDQIDYTLTVHNLDSAATSGWLVRDALPAALSDASTETPGCTIAEGILSCTGGALAAGGDAVITLTAAAAEAGVVDNTGTVVGNNSDPDPSNNDSTVRTIVADDPAAPMADWAIGGAALFLFAGGLALRQRRRQLGRSTA